MKDIPTCQYRLPTVLLWLLTDPQADRQWITSGIVGILKGGTDWRISDTFALSREWTTTGFQLLGKAVGNLSRRKTSMTADSIWSGHSLLSELYPWRWCRQWPTSSYEMSLWTPLEEGRATPNVVWTLETNLSSWRIIKMFSKWLFQSEGVSLFCFYWDIFRQGYALTGFIVWRTMWLCDVPWMLRQCCTYFGCFLKHHFLNKS